jgi:hypothetical protein
MMRYKRANTVQEGIVMRHAAVWVISPSYCTNVNDTIRKIVVRGNGVGAGAGRYYTR